MVDSSLYPSSESFYQGLEATGVGNTSAGRSIFQGREEPKSGPSADTIQAFKDAAVRYNVPADVLMSIAEKDSNFNEFNRSRGPGPKVRGIINVTDDEVARGENGNPYEPGQNINAAAQKLRSYLDAGMSVQDAVKAHIGGADPSKWSADTDAYAQDVLSRTQRIAETYIPEAAPRVVETETHRDAKGQAVPPTVEEQRQMFGISDPGRPGVMQQLGEDVQRGTANLANLGRGLKGMAQAAVGDEAGAKATLDEYVKREYLNARENPAIIGSYKNISRDSVPNFASDAGRYAVEKLGENAAMFLPALATGGIGAGIGRAITERAAVRFIEDQVAKGMTREAAETLAAKMVERGITVGAAAGAAPSTVGMETGSIGGDIYKETGQIRPDVAAVGGVAAGALDLVEPVIAIKKAFGPSVSEPIKDMAIKAIVKRVGVEGLKQLGIEGGTEAVQTVIEKASTRSIDGKQLFTPELFDEVVDSALAGAIGGGVMGVGSQAVAEYSGRNPVSPPVPSQQTGADRREPTIDGGVTTAPEGAAPAVEPQTRADVSPAATAEAARDLAAGAPGRQIVSEVEQPAKAAPATARPGGQGPLSRVLETGAPDVAPLATAAGERVTLSDEMGSLTGTIVSQDADGVLFKSDDGAELLIDNQEIVSGKVSIAKGGEAQVKRPSLAEAIAAYPDGEHVFPTRDEEGYDNPEYLHLRNLYSSHPELDFEGVLKLLSEQQKEMERQRGVVGYPDPRTSDLLGEDDIAAVEAAGEDFRSNNAKDITPSKTITGDSNLAEQAVAAVQPATAPVERQLSEMSEEELRAKLKYIADQGKANGWNKVLTKARTEVEKAIHALKPAPDAEPSPVAKNPSPEPLPEEPAAAPKHADEATIKRLLNDYSATPKAMQAKLDMYGLNDAYETYDKGNNRYGIRAKAAPVGNMQQFDEASGTLGVPRAEMPQVKSEHHGALTNFLNAKGIEHETTTVAADDLKPTQAEFSPEKVEQAKEEGNGERAVIVSEDGHVIDGHHQWLAAKDQGEDVKAIVLKTDAETALEATKEFPSASTAQESAAPADNVSMNPEKIDTSAERVDDANMSETVAASKPKMSDATEFWRDLGREDRLGYAKLAGVDPNRIDTPWSYLRQDEQKSLAAAINAEPATLATPKIEAQPASGKPKRDAARRAEKKAKAKNATGEASVTAQPAEAEHKDAGEPSETASQNVVNETVTKAANAEKVSPSQMRDWLVGEIDKALTKLPKPDPTIATSKPHTSRGKVEFHGAKGTLGEPGYISVTVREQNRDWGIYASNGNGKYGGKSELIYSFDASGPAAARKAAEALLDRAYLDEDGNTKIGEAKTVTFDVPGDGKFNVVNTVQALTSFRDRVMKSSGFKGKSAKSSTPATSKPANQSEDVAAAPPAERSRRFRDTTGRPEGFQTDTSSVSPADENIATGSESGKAAEKPATSTIQDAGEKIGGARKDTATSTGPKKERVEITDDDTPAWRKRYSVAEEKINGNAAFILTDTKTGKVIRNGFRPVMFESREAAEKAIPLYAVAQKHRVYSSRNGDGYAIYRRVTDKKTFEIKSGFKTREDAERYMAENAEEILGVKTGFGEEILAKPKKVSRTGATRREGNVNENDFINAFGFRGVEFGNWNNQAERQEVVNAAYDGLMDLAEVLGLPPRALTLDGELALAFGARGHGLSGAKAHYERDYGVINLTKMTGAGSLAHEWFHALDHYLGRQDGKAARERIANERGDMAYPAKGRGDDYVSHGFRYKSDVRPELRDAYNAVMDVMYNKAEQYVEDTEKAAKFLKAARESLDNALKDVRKNIASDITYRQRNNKAASQEQLAAFDALAEQLLNGENLNTEVRYNTPKGVRRLSTAYRMSNDVLDQMSAVLKSVRGTAGFTSERTGLLDRVASSMSRYAERIAMMKAAEASDVKTKKVPTSYAMEAKKIDQGRSTDYWTTPHEMAARAFSAFVEDTIADSGNRSDFLAYGANNDLYKLFGVRPFPEGQERVEINKAFQNLVDTFKVREGKNGPDTALYSVGKTKEPEIRAVGLSKTVSSTASYVNDQPLKSHADYRAAKAGDIEAATRFVADVAKQETIEKAKSFGPDVIFAPVGASEAKGVNMIPAALAELYAAHSGAESNLDIIQTNKAYHTGAPAMERLLARSTFDGPVEAGRNYVIIDDVTVMGSTLADMAAHIQRNGGNVVGVITLANASRVQHMSASKAQIKEIERRFGDVVRETFHVEPSALTGAEATYVLNHRDADALRTRVAAAEAKRGQRLRAQGVSEASPETSGVKSSELTETITSGKDGPIIKAMIDSGRVVIHDTAATAPGFTTQRGPVQAAVTPDGKIHLVAGNLNSSTALGVLLHEIFHSGVNSLIGDKAWKNLLNRIETMSRNPSKGSWMAKAKARAKAAKTSDAHMAEEIGAYAIEDAENAPAGIREIADRIVGAVKAFILRKFGKQLGEVTPGQLRALAIAALRSGSMSETVNRQVYSNGPMKGFTVYHGSPHSFDKFDISKIGTGEGAQSYGHGLYFAENENVAKSYKEALSGGIPAEVQAAVKSVDNLGFNSVGSAIANIRKHPDWMKRWDVDPNRSAEEAEAARIISDHVSKPRGAMYQVRINADPEKFLDWDKPLAEQPSIVKEALQRAYASRGMSDVSAFLSSTENTGSDAYESLGRAWGGKNYGSPKVAAALKEAGVPGIKYFDQISRSKGDGSRNYVIFDDADVEIENKYSIASDTISSDSTKDKPVIQRAKDRMSDIVTTAMYGVGSEPGKIGVLALTPVRPLFTELSSGMPAARHYIDTKQAMDAFRNEMNTADGALMEEWIDWAKQNRDANDALVKVMFDATLDQYEPDPNKAHTNDHPNPAIQKAYDALPKDAKKFYAAVRDAYTARADAMEKQIFNNVKKSLETIIRDAERKHAAEMQRIKDEGLKGEEKAKAIEAADKALSMATTREDRNRKARLKKMRDFFERNRLKGPYFPLARFGNYFVTLRDAEGKVLSFEKYETVADQRAAAEAYRAAYGDDAVQVGAVGLETGEQRNLDANFVSSVDAILKDAGVSEKVRDQIYQTYLETLPDLSMRKHQLHRKGRAGFNEDAVRSFAHVMFHSAHQLSRLKYSIELQDHLAEAATQIKGSDDPVRTQAVYNEMVRTHDFAMNPEGSSFSYGVTSLTYLWTMAANLSTAMVNAFQSVNVGIPNLAFDKRTSKKGKDGKMEHVGIKAASKALKDATIDFLRGKGSVLNSSELTNDERAAVSTVYDTGLIDATQAHDLAGMADKGFQYTLNPVRNAWSTAMRWASEPMHQTERFNREITFLAAYRLARKAGLEHQEAIKTASDQTWATHFDNQASSKPRFARGEFGRMAFALRSYQVNLLYRIFRDMHQSMKGATPEERQIAGKRFVSMVAITGAVAGVRGAPFYGMLMMLAGAVFGLMGKDDDDPEEALRKIIAETAGDSTAGRAVAGMLMDGVPGYWTGTALTNRIGMGDLWFRGDDRDIKSADQAWIDVVSEILGAPGGVAKNAFYGAYDISNGNTERGIERMLPSALKNIAKTWRYGRDGVQDKYGNPIVENVPVQDLIKQFIGLTPAEIADRYNRNTYQHNVQDRIKSKATDARKEVARAIMAGDKAAEAEGQKKVGAFNDRYPEYAIRPKSIIQSMRNMQNRSDRMEFGVDLDPKLAERVKGGTAPSIYAR